MNAKLVAVGAAMGKVNGGEAPAPPTTLACNLSPPTCTAPQPLSLYCRSTVAVVAVKVDGDRVALPRLTQAEVTLILTGEPTDAPLRAKVKVV